jgi:hypothetical protein
VCLVITLQSRLKRRKSFMDSELVLFELQICPSDYRFAVAPEQVLVFGYREGSSVRPHTVFVPYQGNEQLVQSVLESLHWLVVANDIMSLPPRDPERVFDPDYMNEPSIHIDLAYSDGQSWKSRYPLAEVPPNVQALVDQSKYLGQQEFKDGLAKPGTDTQAAMFQREGALPESAKRVGRVKLFLSGKIEMDGQEMSPAELQEELRKLRLLDGEVWYYRENPHEPLPSNLSLIGQFIVDSINALRLPVKICTEDFS